MANIGIFYGSSTGNTETVAEKIRGLFGAKADLYNVEQAKPEDTEKYNYIILGASTWGLGDVQDDMDEFIMNLESMDLMNKKIAIFGLGDADCYPDSFVDSIGCIYDCLKEKTHIVGFCPTNGYSYDASAAEIDEGMFAGLPIDEDNESSLTDERVEKWVNHLKTEFN